MKTIPPFALDKLDALATHDEAMTLYARSAMDAANSKRLRLGELNNELVSIGSSYAGVNVDPAHGDTIRKDIQRLEAAIEAHVAEYARRHELAITANHNITTARDFLQRLKDNVELVEAEPIRLGQNGDLKRLLAAVRNALADKQAALATTRRARLPETDIHARAESFVERLARSQMIVPTVGPEEFKLRFLRPGQDPTSVPNPLALIARLLPRQMVALLVESAAAVPAGPAGLSEAERPAKIAELEHDVDDLERQEEALIVAILDSLGIGCVVVPVKRKAPPAQPREPELEAAE